jgi:hypothetical protein
LDDGGYQDTFLSTSRIVWLNSRHITNCFAMSIWDKSDTIFCIRAQEIVETRTSLAPFVYFCHHFVGQTDDELHEGYALAVDDFWPPID